MTYLARSLPKPARDGLTASFAATHAGGVPFRVMIDVVQLLDIVLLAAAGYLSFAVVNSSRADLLFGEYAVATLVASMVGGFFLRRSDAYTLTRLVGPLPLLAQSVGALVLGALVSGLCLLLLRQGVATATGWAAGWTLSALASFAAFRLALSLIVRRWMGSGRLDRKVAVVGTNELAEAFIRRARSQPFSRTCIVGLYECEHDSMSLGAGSSTRYPVRGDIDTLLLDCRLRGIDAVVLALPAEDADQIRAICSRLRHVVADIYLAPEICKLDLPPMQIDELGAMPMFPVSRKPMSNWRCIQKAVFDRVIAGLALLFLLPLLSIVALLIRMESPGPVLFRQMRVGFNNNPFQILKFRTMHQHMTDRVASRQTGRNDLRVTSVGRVLRKLSIDELPQLINVLRGNMSLVGPRPHAPGTALGTLRVDEVLDEYAQRHRVKPGITGLAQVRGCRGEMATEEQVTRRVKLDIEYIERWSLWLDVKILLLTVQREICSRNAF